MQRTTRLLVAAVLVLVPTGLVVAQTLVVGTVDGGGGRSAGGSFVLEGSIGQPDAQLAEGGSWRLRGGFWFPAPATAGDAVFHDGFESTGESTP